jgi:uncharacterized protein YegL
MDNRKTGKTAEVVFIIDRSGSMAGLEADTIGGFNSTLNEQKKSSDNVIWSTVLFDHEQEVIHDRVPIDRVKELTREDYFVRGSTALLDAVGGAIHHIGNVHKYARAEDVPERTLFVITTDGMENYSCRYTYREVEKMIRRQHDRYGWEFLFMGANMDAVKTAGQFGIDRHHAVKEPLRKIHIIGIIAHDGHIGVRVHIDQARHDQVFPGIDRLKGLILPEGLKRDAAVTDIEIRILYGKMVSVLQENFSIGDLIIHS